VAPPPREGPHPRGGARVAPPARPGDPRLARGGRAHRALPSRPRRGHRAALRAAPVPRPVALHESLKPGPEGTLPFVALRHKQESTKTTKVASLQAPFRPDEKSEDKPCRRTTHHRDHRFLRRRDHVGHAHLRADLPARERERGLHRGDSFHRYDRVEMKAKMAEALATGNRNMSHFAPRRTCSPSSRSSSAPTARRARQAPQVPARRGRGRAVQAVAGTFTPWEDLRRKPTSFSTRAARRRGRRRGRRREAPDLLIGVVPVINLEWIQKLHRDRSMRAIRRKR